MLCSCLCGFPWWPIQRGSAGNSPVEKWEGHSPPEGAPRMKSTQHIWNIARIFFSWNHCAWTKYWTNMFFKMEKLRRWQILLGSVWRPSVGQFEAHDGHFDKAGGKAHNRNEVLRYQLLLFKHTSTRWFQFSSGCQELGFLLVMVNPAVKIAFLVAWELWCSSVSKIMNGFETRNEQVL